MPKNRKVQRRKVQRLSDGRLPFEAKAATLERRSQLSSIDPLIRESKKRASGLRPDLGTELLLRGVDHPFTLSLFGDGMLAYDHILGWVYGGVCHQCMTKNCKPFVTHCVEMSQMMASIALGKIPRSEADKLIEKLRGPGLLVQASREDGYRTTSGAEYVVPLLVRGESSSE